MLPECMIMIIIVHPYMPVFGHEDLGKETAGETGMGKVVRGKGYGERRAVKETHHLLDEDLRRSGRLSTVHAAHDATRALQYLMTPPRSRGPGI
jgi:hypothetical protein